MREIKFRVWAKNTKKMMDLEDCLVGVPFSYLQKYRDVYILLQYTGLKDIDGVEIYEGDIVQIIEYESRYDGKWDEFRSKVIFNEGYFGYLEYEEHIGDKVSYPLQSVCSQDGTDHKGSHFCNVIGNIYEHKHLLGE